MAGNMVKEVMVKLSASDGDTEAKLDKIAAKADELARKHPDLKVKVDSAAASAKLAVLRKDLKDTSKQADQTGGRFKALGEALNIGLLGGISGKVGEMSTFGKVMAGLNLATGLGEPLVAGLAVAAGGLASGLAAAGLGAGVFGLAAKGAYAQVEAADKANKKLTGGLGQMQQGLKSATGEWNRWVKAASPGVASVIAQGLGLIPKALSAMTPFLKPVETALHGIISDVSHGLDSSGFKSFMDTFAKASGPMLTGFAKAIGNVVVGIGGILKAFLPVSHGIVGGLDNITKKFANWGSTLTQHSGFKSLMSMFKSETPLAVSALKSLAGIIKQVGSSMTGLDTFSNSKMLLQLANPVLKFANALLKAHPELVWLVLYLKLGADGGKKLHTAITGISGALGALQKGKQYLSDFAAGFGSAEKAASEASGAAGTMGGKFSSVLSSVGGWAKSAAQKLGLMTAATEAQTGATEEEAAAQGEADAAMDANPIGLIILAIAALAAGIYELVRHWKDVENVAKTVWHAIEDATKTAWHAIGNVIKTVWDAIKSAVRDAAKAVEDVLKGAWDAIKTAASTVWRWLKDFINAEVNGIKTILNWFGHLGSLMRGWWDDAVNAVKTVAGDLISFVKGLPGKILRGLGDLGSLLINAGEAIIRGFLNGLKRAWQDVTSFIGGIGSWIASHKGPISVDAVLLRPHGQAIMDGLVGGMQSRMPVLTSQLQRTSQAISRSVSIGSQAGAARSAGGGSSGWIEARVQPTGDAVTDAIFQRGRLWIRAHGGGGPNSVQRALGATA